MAVRASEQGTGTCGFPAGDGHYRGVRQVGHATGLLLPRSIHRLDDEWRRRLAVDQFQMTRRADTELAFTGAYWNTHDDGIYRCVCWESALFDSAAKYNSGTGWPSFTEPMAKENVVTSPGFELRYQPDCGCVYALRSAPRPSLR